MKTRLLKWMVRCSLPLSLLALLGAASGGCRDNAVPGVMEVTDPPKQLPLRGEPGPQK